MFKLKQKQNNVETENEENARNVEKQNVEQKVEQSTEQNQPLSESQTVSIQSVEEDNKKKGKEDKKVIKWGPNRVLQCFAYFSVALIAIAMILRLIFKNQPDIAIYMQGVGECLAYIVCIWLGFYFTRKRGNIWWLVGWIIASVILVIFYIFAIV